MLSIASVHRSLPLMLLVILLGCRQDSPQGETSLMIAPRSASATPSRCLQSSSDYRPHEDQRALRALLNAQEFDALEARLGALQKLSNERYCSDRPFTAAFAALEDGAPAMAPIYDAWIAAFPVSAHAWSARGGHHVARGQAFRGSQYASQTKNERLVLMAEQFRLAANDLEAALKIDPRHAPAGRNLVVISRHQGEAQTTVNLYDRLAEAHPDSYETGSALVFALTPSWGGTLDAVNAAADQLASRAAANPDLAMLPSYAQCLTASHLAMADRELDALMLFASIVKQHGSNLSPWCWARQARLQNQLGRHADAAKSFKRYFDLVGPMTDVSEAAQSLAALDRLDEAEALYRSALELNQGSPDLFCDLAQLEYRRDRADQAKELIQKGLELIPDAVYCTRLKASIAANQNGDPQQRLARLLAIAEDSRNSSYHHMLVADALIELGRHTEALAAADQAIALDNGHAQAYYYRALALEHLRDPSNALEAITHAVRLNPDERAYWGSRGRLRVMLGRDLPSAIRDLREAIGAREGISSNWYALAGAYYKQRNCEFVPTLREYLQRCESEHCDPIESGHAKRMLGMTSLPQTCPQHF